MHNDKREDRAPASACATNLEDYARRFRTVLLRYFQRHGAQLATAEDLVQEVFVRLAKRVEGGDIDNPEAYLMRTASHVLIDHRRLRARRRHDAHVDYVDAMHAPEAFSAERVLEGKERVQRLVAALKALPDRTRQVYVLCRIEGMKRKDVARRLGVSVSAVEKHLMSATARIGALFGDEE